MAWLNANVLTREALGRALLTLFLLWLYFVGYHIHVEIPETAAIIGFYVLMLWSLWAASRSVSGGPEELMPPV